MDPYISGRPWYFNYSDVYRPGSRGREFPQATGSASDPSSFGGVNIYQQQIATSNPLVSVPTSDRHEQTRAPEKYSYNVKVMNPEKAKDFKLFTWHDVHEKFKTPDDLKEKLRECFGEHVPVSDFDVCFFESRSTAASNKKWIISANDLDRMYAMFENNHEITFWCDKKVESITKRTSPDVNEDGPVTKRAKRQAAIDDVRKELAEKHAKKFSEPQYKLWALMITNGQWTDKDNPPNIPLFGCEKSKPAKKKDENTVEVLAGAAIQVIDYFKQSSSREGNTQQHLALAKSGDVTSISPSKKVSIRSQYLQQLHELQKLCDAGTITSAEFAEEKERVLLTLRSLH